MEGAKEQKETTMAVPSTVKPPRTSVEMDVHSRFRTGKLTGLATTFAGFATLRRGPARYHGAARGVVASGIATTVMVGGMEWWEERRRHREFTGAVAQACPPTVVTGIQTSS
jgi:hypothetical protein